MKLSKKALWLFFAILALVLAISVIMSTRPQQVPPSVAILPSDYRIQPQKLPIPDRWISRKWGWYWRLKQRVFGPPKIVNLIATVFEFSAPPEELLSSLGAGEATFTNSSGAHVWVADQTAIVQMKQRVAHSNGFRVTAAPQITSADAAHCRIMQSQRVLVNGAPTDTGVVLDCLPRVHKDRTDLTVVLRVTEPFTNIFGVNMFASSNVDISVLTNFEVAARLQIPPGGGVLLLDGAHSSDAGRATGVFISTDIAGPKAGFSSRVTRIIAPTTPPRSNP